MRKLVFIALMLMLLCLPLIACAVELPDFGTRTSFSGELPEALKAAFSDPIWTGWNVEVGYWQRSREGMPTDTINAQLLMSKDERRALCALRLVDGALNHFESSESALYPERMAALEVSQEGYDTFYVAYHNLDGTTEQYRWVQGYDGTCAVQQYTLLQGDQTLLQIDISGRELRNGEQAVFNTQPIFLSDFIATAFPKTWEQACVLSAQSPMASPDTALTRDLTSEQQALTNLYDRADGAGTVCLHYYGGVTVEVLDGGDEDWAHIRVGIQEGYMRREGLLFSSDKAFGNPYDGGSGQVEVPFPAESVTLHERPSVDAASPGEIAVNEFVHVLGFTPELAWLQVRTFADLDYRQVPQGQIGFMEARFVIEPSSAIIANPNPQDRLNLRAEPSKDSQSLGEYYNGLSIAFLHGTPNGADWPYVVINGVSGYVEGRFLDYSCDAFPMNLPPLVTVQAPEGAALYADAAMSGTPIAEYPLGSVVEVMGVIGVMGHVHVQDGRSGYMQLEAIGGEPTIGPPAKIIAESVVPIFEGTGEGTKKLNLIQPGDTVQLYAHGFDHWRRAFNYEMATFDPIKLIDHDWVLVVNKTHEGAGFVRWSQLHPAVP